MATAAAARVTKTFAEIIRLVADEFGDLLVLTATALGTTTSMIDKQHINIGMEALDGREITFRDGTNAGLTRTILTSVDLAGTITFEAVTGAVAAGVTADVVNTKGIGFYRDEYKRFINRAILSTAGRARVTIVTELADEFSTADGGLIDIPEDISEVFRVEYLDTTSNYRTVKKSTALGGSGWSAIRGTGTVRLVGEPARYANQRPIQVWGYGRQDELTADSDTCAVNVEYIIAHAAYHLAKANLRNRPDLNVLIPEWSRRMEQSQGRLRTPRHPDSQAVR